MQKKKLLKGLVIGKFYPLHKGHHHLISTAHKNSDELSIIVCGLKEEKIDPELRKKWIESLYPYAKVYLFYWEGIDDSDSKIWADITKKLLGFIPDVVFTSENYGNTYANLLESRHFEVDIKREKYPISGTMIRQNTYKYWSYLTPPVKEYFTKRIAIIGAESTGTTTLATALASHLHTTWVPEYGREYFEKNKTMNDTWTTQEFIHIAQEQNKREDEMVSQANKLLILDTDSFATSVWHERYMNTESEEVLQISQNRQVDLYIVTDVDIPFIQDGTRDGEIIRKNMHQKFINKLKKANKKFILASGTPEQRLANSISEIKKTFPGILEE